MAIVLGVFLAVFGILKNVWALIYGISTIIIGVFILFNKKEDDIEQIKGQNV